MRRFLIPLLVVPTWPALADMYPNGSNAKLPTTGTPASAVCATSIGALMSAPGCDLQDVRLWGAVNDGGVTDSSAAINAAIAYVASVGGYVNLMGGTYGVCANPVNFTGTHLTHLINGVLVLQTGCGTPPEEILHNTILVSNGFQVNNGLEDLTVDGGCKSKYVYKVEGGNQTTHKNVVIQNPAPASLIPNSAGVYIKYGFELQMGASNWITATGPCYNSGNLPAYGLYHEDGSGNANFTGLLVVNFTTGIYSGGDDYFGPGTHIWGGCYSTGSGCSFNAALRTQTGLILNGSGSAIGVELDDPAVNGIVLAHTSTLDRMIVTGTDCVYSGVPTFGQSCVLVKTGVSGSLVSGTIAPQLAAAGFPNHIVGIETPIDQSTTITDNPHASTFAGAAAGLHMSGNLPASPEGCINQTGYTTPASACAVIGWMINPINGCEARSLTVAVDNAPGAGNTLKFTLQDAGVDTAMTGTISGASGVGALTFTDNTHTVKIPPGDSLGLHVSTTAGAPVAAHARAVLYGCG